MGNQAKLVSLRLNRIMSWHEPEYEDLKWSRTLEGGHVDPRVDRNAIEGPV